MKRGIFRITLLPAWLFFSLGATEASVIFSENFDLSDGGFTVTNVGPVEDPWIHSPAAGTWLTNGTQSQGTPTWSALDSPSINVTTSSPLTLIFDHRYNFEFDGITSWEGGQVQISVNGGAFVAVPDASFLSNGYTGTIIGNNVLNGQPAFNSVSGFSANTITPGSVNGTFITSVANLGSFNVSDMIALRFLAAWDEFVEGNNPNWEIDAISITQVPEPTTIMLMGLGLVGLGFARYKRRLNA